jgi:hypothetical protein
VTHCTASPASTRRAAGWFAVDADDLALAGQVLPEALKLAALAGDNLLTAQVWNYMAMRARQAGEGGEIHQISRTALRSTAARQHPRAAALFHCRAAYGRAWRGERRQALRSLQRAHDALGNASEEDVPTWLGFVNRAQLFAQEALVHSVLGQWNEAVESPDRPAAHPGCLPPQPGARPDPSRRGEPRRTQPRDRR